MDKISKKSAEVLGLRRFFTGKPCKHGHISERYTMSYMCVECCRIRGEKKTYKIDNVREKIFNKTSGFCYFCGSEILKSNFQIDHFLPKSKGGGNNIENLFPVCKLCNNSKNNNDIEFWRKKVAYILEGRPHISKEIIDFLYKKGIKIPEPKRHVFWFEK